MLFTLLSLFIALVALALVYKAIKMLWLNSWFSGFVRGLVGLSILAVGVAVAVAAFDVYSYKQILQEQVVATISFDNIEAQHFDALVVDKEGKQTHYDIRGDQWQIDARIIKWQGYLASFGLRPAYRLDRLSGRYFDIEQETSDKRTAHPLGESYYGLDTWQFVNKHPQWLPFVDTTYGSATYLPMKDKALFQVILTNSGLIARPVNEAAREAVAVFN
jgi:hypothetical protein